MPEIRIDLYSDTLTKPTKEMREFALSAEVGDEQRGEDPSVNVLQDMVAEMLGKEAALFLPSGTMCNVISFVVHCRAGEVVLLDRTAHPFIAEGGAASVVGGVVFFPLDGERGMFSVRQLEEVLFPPSRYRPPARLLSIEQTVNLPGGLVWPLERIWEVCATAKDRGLSTHMDGARLLNASVATGISVADYAQTLDSVWIDLSKGVGAPVGAVLAGTNEFITQAWQWKQRLGGAMRQAGIIAAAGIYGLRHQIERLAEDHENAKRLAQGIAGAPGIGIDPGVVETNIVRFNVDYPGLTAYDFADRLLQEEGVRVSVPSPASIRVVPHLGISRADVETAAASIRALGERLTSES